MQVQILDTDNGYILVRVLVDVVQYELKLSELAELNSQGKEGSKKARPAAVQFLEQQPNLGRKLRTEYIVPKLIPGVRVGGEGKEENSHAKIVI